MPRRIRVFGAGATRACLMFRAACFFEVTVFIFLIFFIMYSVFTPAPLAYVAKGESGVRSKLDPTAWVQFLPSSKHKACLLSRVQVVVRK